VRVVPFGRDDRVSAPSPVFITSYTAADLERDVTFPQPGTLEDVTTALGVNAPAFVVGEAARYTLTLANGNPRVAQDLDLVAHVPAGTAVSGVTAGGEAVPFNGPDGAGLLRVFGMRMPLAGELPVVVDLRSASDSPNGLAFGLTDLSLEMPELGLVRPTPPAASNALTVAGIDTAGFVVSKAVVDDGTPANGIGLVRITLEPGASLAAAGLRFSDLTKTEASSSATAASFTGTAVLPPAGTALGLTTADHLDLRIDTGSTQPFRIFGPGYDAETLIGQLNTQTGFAGLVTAARVGNRFYLERTAQGANRTLEIMNTSTANVLTALGLTPGKKASGFQADFSAVTATQPGGTAWSVSVLTNTWTGATGVTNANLLLRPPAAFVGGDGPGTPITLTYAVKKLNGTAATVGGGPANFGTRFSYYNLVSPYNDPVEDRAFTPTAPDAAAVSDL
jgi:hypothetical protein